MGCAMPFSEDQSFEEKVKCLADEELLEIWAESQQIETLISSELPSARMLAPNYEQAIINELTARASRKYASQSDLRAPG